MADALTEEQVQAGLLEVAKNALAATSGAAEAEAAAKAEADAKAAAEAAEKAKADAGDAGEGEEGDDEIPYKNASDRKNFSSMRRVIEELAEARKADKERADRLEQELTRLRTTPEKDPLEEMLEKMDANERERLRATGVLPLLQRTVEEVKGLRSVKQTVEELRKDREDRAREDRANKNYYAALGEYGKDNGLDKDLLKEMDALIDSGKVAGEDAKSLFDNAREYADLKRGSTGKKGGGDADKAALAARKAAASGADASAGSAAGSPTSSKKALVDKYQELSQSDPAEADRILIASLTNPGDMPRLKVGAPPK